MSEKVSDEERLLLQVNAVSDKYDVIYEKTGLKYNIFQIAGIDSKEVLICRIIADLLNPKGRHAQGRLFLNLFMAEIENNDIQNAKYVDVSTEYRIQNNRRIDIIIQTEKFFIPIEVKIHAADQKNQCKDYFEYAKSKNPNITTRLYYLTLDGHPASNHSCDNQKQEEITPISFSSHIINWLEKSLQTKQCIQIAPIREIIGQLIRSIKNLCGIQEDEFMSDEIRKLIFSDEKNAKAAENIFSILRELPNPISKWQNMKFESDEFANGNLRDIHAYIPKETEENSLTFILDSGIEVDIVYNGMLVLIFYDEAKEKKSVEDFEQKLKNINKVVSKNQFVHKENVSGFELVFSETSLWNLPVDTNEYRLSDYFVNHRGDVI